MPPNAKSRLDGTVPAWEILEGGPSRPSDTSIPHSPACGCRGDLNMKSTMYSSDSNDGRNSRSTKSNWVETERLGEMRSRSPDCKHAIDDLADGIDRSPNYSLHDSAIAIVGMASRLPGDATSPEAFWEMLLKGKTSRTEVSKERYNANALYREDSILPNVLKSRWGHFLQQDIGAFDAPFFSISPKEAMSMDPQHRLLLETTYEAFENAGQPLRKVSGSKTSVFVGCFGRDYDLLLSRDSLFEAKQQATGNAISMAANRLSWFFDLAGPSVTVDTACSSSLTALHLACQDLRQGQSRMAVVGGTNLILSPVSSIGLGNVGCLSPDGISYSFDHRANGYGRGEGVGVVILKPLCRALDDGDTIRAVIRATGANQDGRTVDIAQPRQAAQEAMIRETYASANLSMEPTRYVEAHGTGTVVGDPIEIAALQNSFFSARSKEDPLYVGAVKSNIGHTEATSGIASLIKTVLVLEKAVIPGNVWFEKPGPSIEMGSRIIKFPTSPIPWPTDGMRRASISSYGFGGANAHAILDDANHYLHEHGLNGRHTTITFPLQRGRNETLTHNGSLDKRASSTSTLCEEESSHLKLFPWSAIDENAMNRIAQSYQIFKRNNEAETGQSSFMRDLAFTLCKRTFLPFRSCIPARTFSELLSRMGKGFPEVCRSLEAPQLGFVFTGQGAQWPQMGRGLKAFPTFLESLRRSEEVLACLGCKWSLLGELAKENATSMIDDPAYAQPICAALQIALVDLLEVFRAVPSKIVGHSSGEIAAAYCRGAICRDSALRIAYARGLVMSAHRARQSRETEGMLAVSLCRQDAETCLREKFEQGAHICVACINSPSSVTISGQDVHIERFRSIMAAREIFTRRLKVDVAYHSPSMQDAVEEYRAMIHKLKPRELAPIPEPVMFSTVTGLETSPASLLESEYWVNNLVSPVQFLDAASRAFGSNSKDSTLWLANNNCAKVTDLILEIGPHSTLKGPLREILRGQGTQKTLYRSMLIRDQPAHESTLRAMADLWCHGFDVDMNAINTRDSSTPRGRLLTCLPPYPFDRSKRYWLESRLSRNQRCLQHPYHDLLGIRDPELNGLEAKWRSLISLRNRPWVEDHAILGNPIYPASGLLVMVIEGVRQLLGYDAPIAGFHFRDTIIPKALTIPSKGDVETNLYIRPNQERSNQSTKWHGFRICSLDNEDWSENCKGSIAVILNNESQVDHQESGNIPSRSDFTKTDHCDVGLGTKQMYDTLKKKGIMYGPSFRLLHEILADGAGTAIAAVDVQGWKMHRPPLNSQSQVIHPAALDAMFQLPFAALMATDDALVTAVPTLIRNMWISSNIMPDNQNDAMPVTVQTKARKTGLRNTEFVMSAKRETDRKQCVYGEVYYTSIDASPTDPSSRGEHDLVSFKVLSKPDIGLMKKEEIETYCQRELQALKPPSESTHLARLVCLLACTEAQRTVQIHDIPEDKPYLKRYKSWIDNQANMLRQRQHKNIHLETILDGDVCILREVLEAHCSQLKDVDPTCRIIARSAESLCNILTGEIDALDLFFQDDLINNYYRHDIESTSIFQQLEVYVDLMIHKDPSLRFLEIGAGTGAATQHILFSRSGDMPDSSLFPRATEYTFTDIAPSFLHEARTKFQSLAHRMDFATLDIEQDPEEQGFQNGSYDVVIASNVLHAVADVVGALKHVRRLLKVGGKLILHEAIAQGQLMPGFVFGMLPGWWLGSESERSTSPLLTEPRWHDYLVMAGFTGVDISLRDQASTEDDTILNRSSLMVSTAPYIDNDKRVASYLITKRSSEVQQAVAKEVQKVFAAAGIDVPALVFAEDGADPRLELHQCISLLELDQSILCSAENPTFLLLKGLLSVSKGVLWVTDNTITDDSPVRSLFLGLARTVRAEHDWLKLCTLSLESGIDVSQLAIHIFEVFSACLIKHRSDETEFIEKRGLIFINRASQAHDLNEHVKLAANYQDPEMHLFGQEPSQKLKLTIGTPGLLDTLRYVDDYPLGGLDSNDLEIKVYSSGINFRDVLIALGQVDAHYLGSECAGVVTKVGSSFQGKFKIGDRVCAMVEGSLRTSARCPAEVVCHIPNGMTFSSAASIPIVFATAHYCLNTSARLQSGETILIHSGCGGLGQACIQLAQLKGAIIYATVGTQEKRSILEKRYGIPAHHIFSSRDVSFQPKVLELTYGRGVDVVINSLAGEALRASWELIAPNGRFIEVGKKDIYGLGTLPMYPFAKMATFSSVDLACLFQSSPEIIGHLVKSILDLHTTKLIREPFPLQIHKGSDIAKVFRLMQSGQSSGKFVIELREDDLVPIVRSTQPKWSFDTAATYVLSGGFGGLGRSICRWMISRGARHFLILSRFGPQVPSARMFLKEIERKGAVVLAPACDISDSIALAEVLAQCHKTMPPIKGCIQGAMQLQDMRFDQMSVADYNMPLSAKVSGSWNLHTLLPSDLDFFVLLASVSGICGTHGQANYASANTYQDALAQHRIRHGQRCQVLDLGNFRSIGHWEYLSEEFSKAVGAHSYRSIEEKELYAALDYYCDPHLPMPTPEDVQVIVGLELPSSLYAKGIEVPYWMSAPIFKPLYQMGSDTINEHHGTAVLDPSGGGVKIETVLCKAKSLAEAVDTMLVALQEKLARTLNLDEGQNLHQTKSMLAYGLDSLAAVEMRTWFKNVVGAELATFEILSNATLESIALIAAKRSVHVPAEISGAEDGSMSSAL